MKRIDKRSIATTALAAALFCGLLLPSAAPAIAADRVLSIRPSAHSLPFARGERAQSVWASASCLTECGSYCAWGEAACLTPAVRARDTVGRATQGQCLKSADDCDRYCQRTCRTSGGPLLPLDF